MTESAASRQQLLAEIAALQARLDDAEETLRAIQSGEADAFVLSGSDGDHIHTLKGALEPYRVMVEAMGEGAVTLSPDGTLLYCNSHFAEWVKLPREQIVGMSLRGMIAKQDRQRFAAMLPQGADEVVRETLLLQAADGSQTPALFSMSPLPQSDGRVISVVIADLSEVVAAAAARSRLALIVDSSDDAIASITLEGVVQSWNRAAEQLFGYSADEAIGQPLQTLTILPEQADEVTSRFDAIGRGEQTGRVECMWRRKDGSLVEVSVIYAPILNPSGVVVGASINTRDITARKQAEKSLMLFRTLLDHSSDAIEVLEPSTLRFLDVNEAECRALGYSREELLGMRAFDIDPAFTPELAKATEELLRQEGSAHFETEHQRKDGSRFPVEVHTTLVELDKTYILSVVRDITERKAVELALQKYQEQLAEALKIAKIGYWEYEFATDEFTFNDQYYLLHKITAEEAGGYRMSAADFARRYVYPEDAPAVEKNIRLALESQDPDYAAMTETRILSGEGEIVWVEVRFRVEKDLQGNTVRMVGVNQEITERKEADEVLRRTNRALKTLSAGNLALVRAETEEGLLRSLTGVIAEQGGYSLAVVDYAEDDPQRSITPMAWSGFEGRGYLAEHLSWADTERGRLPVSRAIRSGTTQVCHDITTDPSFNPWREGVQAHGYQANIALPLRSEGKTFGALSIYSSEADAFDEEEIPLLEELANDLAYGIITLRARIEQGQHALLLRQGLEQSIQTIAATVESRDPYTAGHQRRVADLATAIAREMGLPQEQVNGIHLAATIHDLGKIRVPSEILSKPGRLNPIEFKLIQMHSQEGYEILKEVTFPWPIATIVLQHHEKLDGSGYPQGLKGEEILLEAKILTVADVVEAMSSHRPYRPGLGLEAALAEIEAQRGIQFEPLAVDACLKLFRERAYTIPE